MECGQFGMDGLSAQRRAAEDGDKDLVRAQIQNLNILEETAMEGVGKMSIVINSHALSVVRKLFLRLK